MLKNTSKTEELSNYEPKSVKNSLVPILESQVYIYLSKELK